MKKSSKSPKNPISQIILEHAPEVVELAEQLLKGGGSPADTAHVIAELVDDLIDWSEVVPKVVGGPIGTLLGHALELGDGPLLVLGVKAIVSQVASGMQASLGGVPDRAPSVVVSAARRPE